jgi:hypothetical protein
VFSPSNAPPLACASGRPLSARRPVGPSYNRIGGGVDPNVTTPPDTRFTTRFPQLAVANCRNSRAFSRANNSPTAPRLPGSAASSVSRSKTDIATSTSASASRSGAGAGPAD